MARTLLSTSMKEVAACQAQHLVYRGPELQSLAGRGVHLPRLGYSCSSSLWLGSKLRTGTCIRTTRSIRRIGVVQAKRTKTLPRPSDGDDGESRDAFYEDFELDAKKVSARRTGKQKPPSSPDDMLLMSALGEGSTSIVLPPAPEEVTVRKQGWAFVLQWSMDRWNSLLALVENNWQGVVLAPLLLLAAVLVNRLPVHKRAMETLSRPGQALTTFVMDASVGLEYQVEPRHVKSVVLVGDNGFVMEQTFTSDQADKQVYASQGVASQALRRESSPAVLQQGRSNLHQGTPLPSSSAVTTPTTEVVKQEASSARTQSPAAESAPAEASPSADSAGVSSPVDSATASPSADSVAASSPADSAAASPSADSAPSTSQSGAEQADRIAADASAEQAEGGETEGGTLGEELKEAPAWTGKGSYDTLPLWKRGTIKVLDRWRNSAWLYLENIPEISPEEVCFFPNEAPLEGRHSYVYRTLVGGNVCALKVPKVPSDRGLQDLLVQEAVALRGAQGEGVIQLYGVVKDLGGLPEWTIDIPPETLAKLEPSQAQASELKQPQETVKAVCTSAQIAKAVKAGALPKDQEAVGLDGETMTVKEIAKGKFGTRTENAYGLLTEWADVGSLGDILRNTEEQFSEELARPLMRDLAQALYHLHSTNLVHGNILPENVLLVSEPHTWDGRRALLSGFTLARQQEPGKLLHNAGALLQGYGQTITERVSYTPPELNDPVKNLIYDGKKTDVYSLGTVYMRMMRGKSMEELSPGLRALLCGMLEPIPDDRKSISAVVGNKWLNEESPEEKAFIDEQEKEMAVLSELQRSLVEEVAEARRQEVEETEKIEAELEAKAWEDVKRSVGLGRKEKKLTSASVEEVKGNVKGTDSKAVEDGMSDKAVAAKDEVPSASPRGDSSNQGGKT